MAIGTIASVIAAITGVILVWFAVSEWLDKRHLRKKEARLWEPFKAADAAYEKSLIDARANPRNRPDAPEPIRRQAGEERDRIRRKRLEEARLLFEKKLNISLLEAKSYERGYADGWRTLANFAEIAHDDPKSDVHDYILERALGVCRWKKSGS